MEVQVQITYECVNGFFLSGTFHYVYFVFVVWYSDRFIALLCIYLYAVDFNSIQFMSCVVRAATLPKT